MARPARRNLEPDVGFVLDVIFALVLIRSIWKLLQGVKIGMSVRTAAPPGAGVPPQGVQMAKDPVCGTYVVPERAVSVTVGRQTVYFCSNACRDKYGARTA
jgi:YHS domain-containing protein